MGDGMEPGEKQRPAPAPQQPSVGRIVHFVEQEFLEPKGTPPKPHSRVVCRAAIVTRWPLDDGGTHTVDLTVFGRWGENHLQGVEFANPDEGKLRTWHWPERV